jgi:hypothetical protein
MSPLATLGGRRREAGGWRVSAFRVLVKFGEQPGRVPSALLRLPSLSAGCAAPHTARSLPEVERVLQALDGHVAAPAVVERRFRRLTAADREDLRVGPAARGTAAPLLVGEVVPETDHEVDEQHVGIGSRRRRRNHSATDRNERRGRDNGCHDRWRRAGPGRGHTRKAGGPVPGCLASPPSLCRCPESCNWRSAALGECRSKESLGPCLYVAGWQASGP